MYKYIIWVFLYSFAGWIYETIICSIEAKKLVKRGFLFGPYCPIYGFGALFIILFLSSIQNIILLFLAGSVLTCTLEYITSWAMEKMFNARWWDYSYMKYQLNGRICLLGAVVFGAFTVLVIKVFQPFLVFVFDMIDNKYLFYFAIAILIVAILDFIFTFIRTFQFTEKLKILQIYIDSKIQIYKNNKEEKENFKSKRLKKIMKQFTDRDKKMLKAFPRLKSKKYNEALEETKEYFSK